jgi:eukaryotic-like serine/threonine-protein kinase
LDTGKARVRRIFDEAVEVGAAGRAAFLDRACEGDQGLRGEVEALLYSLDDASGFLATSEPLREVAGSRIGPYRLIEEIGEGGFGVVFLAEQEAPVARLPRR